MTEKSEDNQASKEDQGSFEERRRLLRQIAGIAGKNPDLTPDDLKCERTARYIEPKEGKNERA